MSIRLLEVTRRFGAQLHGRPRPQAGLAFVGSQLLRPGNPLGVDQDALDTFQGAIVKALTTPCPSRMTTFVRRKSTRNDVFVTTSASLFAINETSRMSTDPLEARSKAPSAPFAKTVRSIINLPSNWLKENKTFLPVPALADTDGPIIKFRKWYSQFYAEPYEVPVG